MHAHHAFERRPRIKASAAAGGESNALHRRLEAGIPLLFYDCNKFFLLSDSVCPTHGVTLRVMNRNPIFPNWQLPRRQPFCARRGIALLRALRLRLAEETEVRFVQMQLEFAQFATSPRLSRQRVSKN